MTQKNLFPLIVVTGIFLFCILLLHFYRQAPAPVHSYNIASAGVVPLSIHKSSAGSKGDSIVDFAKTLLGTPYQYATSSPSGFDCSGFVYYVFHHFNIYLTRSSYTMALEGIEIDSAKAEKGDLIFFKGTVLANAEVGHVGIVISNLTEPLQFIHASSGKSQGVVITPLTQGNYLARYIKTVRVIPGRL